MTKEQLEALIEFIRAAAIEAAEIANGQSMPSAARAEEQALRAAFGVGKMSDPS